MPQAQRAAEPTNQDGRRLRPDANRRKIANAMLDLLREGVRDPSADALAERAGVGRRTVFRLFSDKQGLYKEMHAIMLARLLPLFSAPIEGAAWRERLDNLIERRARLFEEMLPIKTAADAQRYRTDILHKEHGEFAAMQRSTLAFVLPKNIAAEKLDMLDLSLSFEAWRRLRTEQRLTPKAAAALMRRLADAICA